MKINPINNYQINRGQKAQAKSNPNFEGVKFVLDKQSPALIEAIKRSCVSPKEFLWYKNRFDAVINKLNHYLNKEVLPRYLTRDFVYYIENGKICRNNDDLKIYQEKYPDNILEKIWPKDTVIQVSYRENFIEDYEIVDDADHWDMYSIPGIARNIHLGENGKGPLLLYETDYADRISESGIEGILTFFEKLRTEKFCEGRKNKYMNDFFRSLLHEQSEYKNYFAIYKANCKKQDELAKNEKNERTQANLKAWLGDN